MCRHLKSARDGQMFRSGVVLCLAVLTAGCVEQVRPTDKSASIMLSSTGSIHGEETMLLYPNDVLVETGWEPSSSPGGRRRDWDRTRQLRAGAFRAARERILVEPPPKSVVGMQEACFDAGTDRAIYAGPGGEHRFEAHCTNDQIARITHDIRAIIESHGLGAGDG